MAEGLGGDTAQVGAQPPFEENLQVGGHGSNEENMSNVRHLLVERMDPDFGLLDKLLQLCALTYPETVQIRGEKSIFDRNAKLLELIFSKMKHQALLTSLTETGQKHLFNLVTGNGGYRPEYSTVWPLGERKTQILDVNRINLVDKICPSELVTSMFSNGVINYRQQEYISSLSTLTEKAGALLDILRRGSEEYYYKTIMCLRESNQGHVAELLLEGGVLARVHVSNEGETETVNEEEDDILETFKALLQNTTSPQLQRMRVLLDLQIMGATKGQSIVFYIYCKNLDELLYLHELLTKGEFKKRIAAVFDLLISKRETTVSAVNWSEDEFTRFKTYFEAKHLHDEKAVKQQRQQSPDPPKQREAEEIRGDEDVGSQIKSLKVEGISKELPTESARDVSPTRREPSHSVALSMADMSKSSKCHLCNVSLKKQCILSFDCSHQLCPNCVKLTKVRSVCPTCSPSTPPFWADVTRHGFPSYTRMYSKNAEPAPPKLSPTSKTIDVDLSNPSKIPSSRLAVPSSSHASNSSSSSSSASCCLSSTDTVFSDSGIVARMDYTESADIPALCQSNQHAGVLARQGAHGHHLQMEMETRRHPKPPYDDDGRRGTGSASRDLVDYVRALKEHSVAFLERLNQTGINEAVFVEKIAAVEQEVRRQAMERRLAIDRAEKELLLKLESRKKEQVLESEAVRQDTELCVRQLDSLTKTIEEALKKRDEDKMDQVLFEVQGDVRRVLERRVETVCFGTVSFIYSPENFLEEDRANILGEIEFPPNKHKADEHLMFLSSPAPLIHSLNDPSYSGQAVIGLTVLANRICVIRTNSHDIEVYHAQYFSPLAPITLLGLMTPMLVPSASDLSSCQKSQTLYVADTANSYVYRIDTDGKLLSHWRLPQNFAGLSVTEIGTVLTGSGTKIIEYDQSGKTQRTIGLPIFCKIRSGIVVDSPRHFVSRNSVGIVVCDWKVHGLNHVVYEIDDLGQMVNYFGGEPGTGDGELNEPCCIATAPLDHVIVADRVNRRVKLLDSGLKFVRNLVDEHDLGGDGQPNRIYLDVATGRLYVGMTDGRIHVYRTIF